MHAVNQEARSEITNLLELFVSNPDAPSLVSFR